MVQEIANNNNGWRMCWDEKNVQLEWVRCLELLAQVEQKSLVSIKKDLEVVGLNLYIK